MLIVRKFGWFGFCAGYRGRAFGISIEKDFLFVKTIDGSRMHIPVGIIFDSKMFSLNILFVSLMVLYKPVMESLWDAS